MKYKDPLVWIPLAISIAVVGGMMLGDLFSGKPYIVDYDRKLNTIFNLIADDYVDTVTVGDLVENAIPKILTELDPHTTYIPAKDLTAVNDELEGSFSGIGISFAIIEDTIRVTQVIPGGPSERAGLMAGDRIVTIDDSTFVGPGLNQIDVRDKHLKGKKNSAVKLGIKRDRTDGLLTFDVIRGDVPVKSVDATYMVNDETGYIKVNKFGRNTYDEFLNALNLLKGEGATRYIVDLRGNAGGFMEMATLMVNEFLSKGELIVYTLGRDPKENLQVWSDNHGSFHDAQVAVIIDEYSASASEIFAGAIQDNDRGIIIGRRSFGKGLVQKQTYLPDSSAIRLTTARYYTPSGRCVQKDYKKGDEESYSLEVYNRYEHGELYNADSIRVDKSKTYKTMNGRTVYGGGGIIPDIFVPNDTSGISSYYVAVFNKGLLHSFAFKYTDINRQQLNKAKDLKHLLRMLPSDDALTYDFVMYAKDNGVPVRWYYISQSRQLLARQLKALIVRDILGMEAQYEFANKSDKAVQAALKALNEGEGRFPVTIELHRQNAKQ